jgi:hypothetical protein
MTPDERRAQLVGWIAKTRRTQKRLSVVVCVLAAIAIALFAWRTDVAGFAVFGVVLFAICAFWITHAHIADWSGRIHEIDHPGPKVVGRRAV